MSVFTARLFPAAPRLAGLGVEKLLTNARRAAAGAHTRTRTEAAGLRAAAPALPGVPNVLALNLVI